VSAVRWRYRSFFWPGFLIVVGLFALLVNLNVISADRLYRLADLWPLVLIVIGLELVTRRALTGAAVDVAAVLILLIAAGGAVGYVAAGPAIPGGGHILDVTGQIGTLNAATLEVDVVAANTTVEGDSSLGQDLYRAHVEYSGPKPSVTFDESTGALRISQQGSFVIFGSNRLTLDLHISPSVTWSIKVNSGAATDTYNLTGVPVGSIEVNTGASREDITLGPPNGIVPIKLDGGALTVRLHRPAGTEASARASGGAVNLTGDGHHEGGIGTLEWQSDGYAAGANAYNIKVDGGACSVTVDTTVP
jgi:Domain of unknown function (DUF5668)